MSSSLWWSIVNQILVLREWLLICNHYQQDSRIPCHFRSLETQSMAVSCSFWVRISLKNNYLRILSLFNFSQTKSNYHITYSLESSCANLNFNFAFCNSQTMLSKNESDDCQRSTPTDTEESTAKRDSSRRDGLHSNSIKTGTNTLTQFF